MPLFSSKAFMVPVVVAAAGAKLTNTGNTTENTLATVTIPGNALGPNGFVRVTSYWGSIANTNTKTCRIRAGGGAGTPMFSISHTTAAHVTSSAITTIQNRNSTASQVCTTSTTNGATVQSAGAVNTMTIDTTVDWTLVFTAQCNTIGTDTVDLERYIVEVCYVP